jgi:hypothetical protein
LLAEAIVSAQAGPSFRSPWAKQHAIEIEFQEFIDETGFLGLLEEHAH